MVRGRRKKAVLSWLVAAALLAASAPALGGPTPQEVSPEARLNVIVAWQDAARGERALGARGVAIARRLHGGKRVLVTVPEGVAAETYATSLQSLPGVAYAEPDYPVSIAWVPNDPYYNAVLPPRQWGPQRIGAESAWDIARGAGTTIAVVDTGVYAQHPDLLGKMWVNAGETPLNGIDDDRNGFVDDVRGWDFFNGDNNPADDNGHGSHCAGIAAAVTDNARGIAGTAPDATVMPVKVLDRAGNGTTALLAQGIDYAVAQGADVISLSVGGAAGTQTLRDSVQAAVAAGVVVVAAAGNYNTAVYYPASYAEAIAVGATDITDTRATYSNFGATLDVMAPGGTPSDMILSTLTTLSATPAEPYGYKYGTSMATPHVAGAAAVLLSAFPSATPQGINAALGASARDLAEPGFDTKNGYGLVQMSRALDYLAATDSDPPTVTADVVPAYDDVANVTFSAGDGTWNPWRVGYRLNGGATQYGFTLAVSVPATHALEFWAEDFAGNVSSVETTSFIVIDTIAPRTTTNARSTYYGGTAAISLYPSDAGSGVAATYHALDGSAVATGTSVVTTQTGDHTLRYWSIDHAGNREATRTATFRLYGTLDVGRVSGPNRYTTAIAVSQSTFASGTVSTCILASGEDYPDALAASGLAGVFGAPLLLTPRDRLPDGLIAEIERLGADRVVIVGGESAVDGVVAAGLATAGLTVEREAGPNRFATARAVAERMQDELGVLPETAFVVRGDGYADALAVSPLAYRQHFPILLTAPDRLMAETEAAVGSLGITEVVVVGGTSAVSTSVQASLDALSGVDTSRLAGTNRYDTAALVASHALDLAWTPGDYVGVATGLGFADALGGGVAAGENGGTLVLTGPSALPEATRAFILTRAPAATPVRIFGGVAVIGDAVRAELAAMAVF